MASLVVIGIPLGMGVAFVGSRVHHSFGWVATVTYIVAVFLSLRVIVYLMLGVLFNQCTMMMDTNEPTKLG